MESDSPGALLRREGIYQSNLKTWRRQRDDNMLSGLKPKKQERKVTKRNPLQKEVDGLHVLLVSFFIGYALIPIKSLFLVAVPCCYVC